MSEYFRKTLQNTKPILLVRWKRQQENQIENIFLKLHLQIYKQQIGKKLIASLQKFIDKTMSLKLLQDLYQMSCMEKCPLITRIFNIASALILIGFGIAGIVMMTVNNLTGGKFFLLFSPIFMILVGLLFLAAEFKFQKIIKHFVFMKMYFSRGVFNMFMASSVFYYFSCGNDNTVVAWIAAILIFGTGCIYIVMGCCCMGKDEEQQETSPQKEELV